MSQSPTPALEQPHSSRRAEVIDVVLQPHPNADTLSTVNFHAYTCIVKTSDWQHTRKAAWIPPDTTCDVRRPEFAFLARDANSHSRARIKAKKIRGVVSYGLLVPVPDDTPIGQDFYQILGLEHYEPPLAHEKGNGKPALFSGAEDDTGPTVFSPKYDLESLLRYHKLFTPGEVVIVTEKLDGANARYTYADGKMHAGSRTAWKKQYPSFDHVTLQSLTRKGVDEAQARDILEKLHARPKRKNLWWDVLERTPTLEKFCQDNPGLVVYGEVYGNVNCIKYGFPDGNRFAAFDILQGGDWLPYLHVRTLAIKANLPLAPLLAHTTYDLDVIKLLADGRTHSPEATPGTIREGCVVSPITERIDPHLGRVKLKCINPAFLEKYR